MGAVNLFQKTPSKSSLGGSIVSTTSHLIINTNLGMAENNPKQISPINNQKNQTPFRRGSTCTPVAANKASSN